MTFGNPNAVFEATDFCLSPFVQVVQGTGPSNLSGLSFSPGACACVGDAPPPPELDETKTGPVASAAAPAGCCGGGPATAAGPENAVVTLARTTYQPTGVVGRTPLKCVHLGERLEYRPDCQSGYACRHRCNNVEPEVLRDHLGGNPVMIPAVDCSADCPGLAETSEAWFPAATPSADPGRDFSDDFPDDFNPGFS